MRCISTKQDKAALKMGKIRVFIFCTRSSNFLQNSQPSKCGGNWNRVSGSWLESLKYNIVKQLCLILTIGMLIS